ncbi:MAG: hypothetical protein ABIO61_10160 [Thermomonas sp.]
MSVMRAGTALLHADLRQRMRTPRFWLLVAGLAALMWWCFPPASADFLTVSVGDNMRGRYSSAWIGMVVALMYSASLSLAGFYLVRGTVTRDLDTKVWQLLVVTNMSRGAYLLSKWLSHLAVFVVLMSAGLAVGLVAQYVRAEDLHLDLIELIKPVIVLTLPSLAVTAALAVWCDMVPWLRRSAGNVLFFVLWVGMLTVGVARVDEAVGATMSWPGDPHGLVVAEYDLSQQWSGNAPAKKLGLSVGSQALEGKPPVLKDWTQWRVTHADWQARGFWLALGICLLLLAMPLLDRFAGHASKPDAARGGGARLRWLDAILRPLQRSAFGALIAAELQLVLRARRAWWWLAMLGVWGTQAFAPDKAMAVAIILGWTLFLDVFARLILREHDTRTSELVFSAPNMQGRLLIVRILVAVGLAWAVTWAALLRLAMTHPQAALATVVAGASLALWGLACGALVRNPRLFELLGLAAMYLGLQGAAVLNVLTAPADTLRWHVLVLPLAALVLSLGWYRGLAARR